MHKPRVLLADDHKIVLEGLRGLLEDDFELAGVASNGRELLDQAAALDVDVIIADISMPLLNGIDAARKLAAQNIRAKVVFLTMHSDPTYATRALEAGASGYVLKHSASEELIAAIREALKGGTYVSQALRTSGISDLTDHTKRHVKASLELTGRQREVLQLLAEGKSAKEIATILEISPRTVETHKYKMMDDLGLKSSAQLVQYAIKHGLVSV